MHALPLPSSSTYVPPGFPFIYSINPSTPPALLLHFTTTHTHHPNPTTAAHPHSIPPQLISSCSLPSLTHHPLAPSPPPRCTTHPHILPSALSPSPPTRHSPSLPLFLLLPRVVIRAISITTSTVRHRTHYGVSRHCLPHPRCLRLRLAVPHKLVLGANSVIASFNKNMTLSDFPELAGWQGKTAAGQARVRQAEAGV